MSRNYYRGFEIHRLPARMVVPPTSMLSLDDDIATTASHAAQTSQWSAINREANEIKDSTDVDSNDLVNGLPVDTQAPHGGLRDDSVNTSPIQTLDGATTPLAAPRNALPLHLVPLPNHSVPGSHTSQSALPPHPPFNLSPLSAPIHNLATATLIDPTYYYTMVRQHSLTDTPRPYPSELFAHRNHAVILDIEQMLADFHLQLKGCHVWADDAALRDLWMRLKQAGKGMRRLEQPQPETGAEVGTQREEERSILDSEAEIHSDSNGESGGDSAGDSGVEA
ncbi:hypothetical protein B0A48_10580 [Cryoendolithus antarcticus]|uniref:Uncharacterized protein n=1 Tax=Cryoendolithus antarcticus TaxID=1507870 RepID=A0A1V8SY86_9PEZI|nr:hypothetical protein B0A48_10580 [Cryoendolithus antarcticus]